LALVSFFVFLAYEFSDMKRIIFSFLLLFFISCTEDKSIPNITFSPDNKLVIRYQGYYERYFELPDKVEAYNDITINQIVEQVLAINIFHLQYYQIVLEMTCYIIMNLLLEQVEERLISLPILILKY